VGWKAFPLLKTPIVPSDRPLSFTHPRAGATLFPVSPFGGAKDCSFFSCTVPFLRHSFLLSVADVTWASKSALASQRDRWSPLSPLPPAWKKVFSQFRAPASRKAGGLVESPFLGLFFYFSPFTLHFFIPRFCFSPFFDFFQAFLLHFPTSFFTPHLSSCLSSTSLSRRWHRTSTGRGSPFPSCLGERSFGDRN